MAQVRLLQVREAARALGIHENTLRRWEETGRIRAVKLPTVYVASARSTCRDCTTICTRAWRRRL